MDERCSSSQPLSAQLYRLAVIAAERPEDCEPRRKLSSVAAGRLLRQLRQAAFQDRVRAVSFFKADFMRFPKPSSAVFFTVFGCWSILKPTSTVPSATAHDFGNTEEHCDTRNLTNCIPQSSNPPSRPINETWRLISPTLLLGQKRLEPQVRRKACYRPGRAHPWPGRIRTCWTTNKVSWRHRILQFPLTSLAWSH
jgi:hypothetical protein